MAPRTVEELRANGHALAGGDDREFDAGVEPNTSGAG